MPVQHEKRRGEERRSFDISSALLRDVERRWNKDQRHFVVDEEELYDSDWDVSDADLEPSADDSL